MSARTSTDVAAKLLVAAGDPLARDLFRRALEQCLDGATVGEATSVTDAAELAANGDAGAILLLMDAPAPQTAAEAIHTLKTARPDLGIVILTDVYDPRAAEALASIPYGGWAYLPRSSVEDAASVLAALRASVDGLVVLDQQAARSAAPSRYQLTRRQREVLELMARGFSNTEIARRLVLEPKSVENHINAIFNQLGVNQDPAGHPRVRAVLMYLRLDRSSDFAPRQAQTPFADRAA